MDIYDQLLKMFCFCLSSNCYFFKLAKNQWKYNKPEVKWNAFDEGLWVLVIVISLTVTESRGQRKYWIFKEVFGRRREEDIDIEGTREVFIPILHHWSPPGMHPCLHHDCRTRVVYSFMIQRWERLSSAFSCLKSMKRMMQKESHSRLDSFLKFFFESECVFRTRESRRLTWQLVWNLWTMKWWTKILSLDIKSHICLRENVLLFQSICC